MVIDAIQSRFDPERWRSGREFAMTQQQARDERAMVDEENQMSEEKQPGPVHFIAHFTVNDPDVYRQYEKGFFPVLKPYGATFVTYDDEVTVLEGQRAPGRTVIITFPSEEVLTAWWNSPEYVELAKLRHASVTTHSVSVVHPLPAR
jgi:uncharacterized protein (DUF1330 family)